MTYAELASIIRFKTRTTSATFTDANILLLANMFKDSFAEEIAKVNEDYFGLDYETDLNAGQREYALPLNVIQIKLVEAKLDGEKWVRVHETDYNLEDFTTDEAGIVAKFSTSDPKFEYFRKSLWLLTGDAIIEVESGLKLKAIIYPADFTDMSLTVDISAPPSSTSHGLPRAFHELLARRIVIEYKETRDKPVQLTEKEQSFVEDFQEKLDSVSSPNLSRSLIMSTPADDGSNY